jgi:ABC-type lipoprotein export system ATPase subunit
MSDETSLSPLYPLRRVEVVELFGEGNVAFDLDPAATILTGENGSGKSTVLRAVSFLSERDWRAFAELPLAALRLSFGDGYELEASNHGSSVYARDSEGQHDEIDLTTGVMALQRELEWANARVRTASPAERNRLRMQIDRLRTRLRHEQAADEDSAEQAWLRVACNRLNTKFISARRLEHGLSADDVTDEGRFSVVDAFASALAQRMTVSLSAYAAESRQQEKVLPSQIVRAMLKGPEKPAEEIAKEVDDLRADVRKLADSLTRVGLFQEEDPDPQFIEYPRNDPSILLAIREVYRVTVGRLQRLTKLRTDLELFESFLNERFTGKQIQLSQHSGIEVVLISGEVIRPSQLSSGEQQLLAVAYELLFDTPPESVVLLDEPELSLHVAWQQGLMSALLGIGERRQLQFVIATHSSSLLAGFAHLEKSLDEEADR